jgi:3',5'-cyclic AMP phosphodiesterase CpdA
LRTIAHISDLHFGRINPLLPPALRDSIVELNPDLVVVSGDLSQRARRKEFQTARVFLDSLPFPKIVVPGNHDVPLHNIWARWRTPLEKYRHYLGDDLEPFYSDAEMAVQGVNTARSLTLKGGRINRLQVEKTCARLSALSPEVTRIVVTHHPFDLPSDSRGDVVGRAGMAVSAFAQCRVDVILSGHFHVGYAGSWARRYPMQGHDALLVQAGTATSTRGRDEANSWNIIRLSGREVAVERQLWNADREQFVSGITETFERQVGGWVPLEPPESARPS